MRIYFATILFLFLASCNDDAEKRQIENIKDAKKKEIIFENINKGWKFSNPELNPQSQEIVNNWAEWRSFVTELNQKPKTTIGAFQKKAKVLSKKAMDLNNHIPQKFNRPEIKSRISVLITKINSINLFINLSNIPDQKVVALVQEVNIEMLSLSQQMAEIIRKEAIPMEEGESDMIRMLDTSRAIPTNPKNYPKSVE